MCKYIKMGSGELVMDMFNTMLLHIQMVKDLSSNMLQVRENIMIGGILAIAIDLNVTVAK